MKFARRVEELPPYLFVGISKKIAEKRAQGVDVISFGVGDPDMPTPPHILDALTEAAHDPATHRYPETEGLPELRQAIATWYDRRFGVTLDPDKEVVPVIGSKEGIGHVPLCFIDPGDVALVPDPGYPVYPVSVQFAGGTPHTLALREGNAYLPDLDAVPADIARRSKLLWLNYPNNPTSATAGTDFFEGAAAFAARHGIAIVHDNAYSEVTFDEYEAPSFLQADGARECGIEMISFSKTYNMAGWRIGAAVGNADMIDALSRVKSNLDSGIPAAIQRMAIAALEGPQESVEKQNATYERRRDRLVEALHEIGLRVTPPKASLYIWAGLPPEVDSTSFAERLLEECGIVVTPGIGYGANGEGYVRLSLTVPDERLEEGVRRLQGFRLE
jgi:LL-diaminopimelate aminotransferase